MPKTSVKASAGTIRRRRVQAAVWLHQLRYVVAVARAGNLSRAAKHCHVSQPALCQQLAKLEQELKHPLFTRTPRAAKLTPRGEAFLRRAVHILQELDAGLALVPAMAMQRPHAGSPVYRSLVAPQPTREIVTVWPKERPLGRAALAFLKLLVSGVRKAGKAPMKPVEPTCPVG